MIKYFVFLLLITPLAIARVSYNNNSGEQTSLDLPIVNLPIPVQPIVSSESNKKIAPVHTEDFKIKIDQSYLNKLDFLANNKKNIDDSIKIIHNANKTYGIEQIILPEIIDNIDTKYSLEAVVSNHQDKEWFVIINKKIYNNRKKEINNLFEIIEVRGRHAVIKFLKFNNKDLKAINNNVEDNYKYCTNVTPTLDGRAILIKLYIGQYYDIISQKIYDGK